MRRRMGWKVKSFQTCGCCFLALPGFWWMILHCEMACNYSVGHCEFIKQWSIFTASNQMKAFILDSVHTESPSWWIDTAPLTSRQHASPTVCAYLHANLSSHQYTQNCNYILLSMHNDKPQHITPQLSPAQSHPRIVRSKSLYITAYVTLAPVT